MDFEEGTCSNEEGSREDLNGGGQGSTRAFIIQVKEEFERCLEAGMDKDQMFRELREKGIHPGIAFAVYKELRCQNHGFFKEYYNKIDLNKQTERVKGLMHQYRMVRDMAAVGTGALGTAASPTAMAIPDVDVGLPEQQIVLAGLDDACVVNSSSGGGWFTGSAAQLHGLARQLLHHREQPVPNGGGQWVVPSAACTSNYAMEVSYPQSCTDSVGMSWHGEQAESLQQWWTGAGVVPPPGSYSQPLSSVEMMLLEKRNHRDLDASLYSEQAEPLQQGRPIKRMREYQNHYDHVTEPLQQEQPVRQPQTPTERLREYRNHYNHDALQGW